MHVKETACLGILVANKKGSKKRQTEMLAIPPKHAFAHAHACSSFLEQIARVHAECFGDLGQGIQLGVGRAILDPADKLLVNAGVGGQRALRQSLGLPELPHITRQHPPDSRLRHPAGWTTDGA